MKEIIRTPESRFENLQGYDFSPNYLEVEEGLRLHYVDDGSKDGPVALLLHGEPSWSYLYRKMIPILAEGGFRVIAPDLIGFGKSDKLRNKEDYTYQTHMQWLTTFVERLDLKDLTLFCQDWGGLLGLRLAMDLPDRFAAIVASNTTLPTGQVAMPESFLKWREFSQNSSDFQAGNVLNMATVSDLSNEVIAAYNAPFPSEDYKAGARIFPMLVPIEADDPESKNNQAAWAKLMQWEKPFLTLFADSDPIMKGAEVPMQQLIPGAKGQNHQILHAGHFIQEDKGEELAELIVAFYQKNFKDSKLK